MFKNLDENDLSIIIGAMKEVTCETNNRVINQGDDGDFLFVIESGTFDCLIKKDDGSPEVSVKTCKAGDFFGELALLYNCPRKASVLSKEKGVVWQLDRDTFNHIVKEAAQKKRNRYDAFLAKVPLLQSMDAYERSQLADALKSETFSDGQTIMSQGEMGHKFYIIEEGEVTATKSGVQVMSYGVGDYFGELALIRDQPRAATCMCKGPSKLLSLDSASFKRLLNVTDLLERSQARYSS
jgi:cAMP-dependent protein kinase regulator